MTVQTHSPAVFGKVAVAVGGISAERAVSLNSGQAVLSALRAQGIDAHGVDLTPDSLHQLDHSFDRVFNLLHGRWGEDGTVQGYWDSIGLPYTGSGVLGCALAMDKITTKRVWQALSLPTAAFAVVEQADQLKEVASQLGWPIFVKPAQEGSSVGVGKASSMDELRALYEAAAQLGGAVMVEQYIAGAELTVAVLEGNALPVVKMTTSNEFYDYHAKYESDETQYECPAELPESLTQRLQALSVEAFDALQCSGWGRVDLMLDAAGEPLLLEVNTVPGMTDHSLVPMAAQAIGISFEQLCVNVLATSLSQEGL